MSGKCWNKLYYIWMTGSEKIMNISLSLDVDMEADHLGHTQIHYLYGRSYFLDIPVKKRNREAVEYYRGQAEKYWVNKSLIYAGYDRSCTSHREGKVRSA